VSIPATNITCNICNYSGSTGVVFGIFKYQTPLGNISLPRTLGWCNSCDSVAPIEDTDLVTRRESLTSDIEDAKALLVEEIERAEISRSFLARLFSSQRPDNDTIRKLRVELANFQQELARPSVLADYLTSPEEPTCLSCGSSDVFRFPKMPAGLDDFDSEDRTPKPIGVRHPDCGGEMYAETSDVRINRRFSERLYSLCGERIA
jgi:hypothetical protein